MYTRQVIHYERGLHMYKLVRSCITNEDSTYTRKVIHYERGIHVESSFVMHDLTSVRGVLVRNA